MNEGLKIGDLVRLKSGSPLMTVVQVDSDTVYCTWFDKNVQKGGEFILQTLIKEKEDGGPILA